MARYTREELLQTYHDGELGGLARLRMRWRLVWSREDRAALERMQLLGDLLRDGELGTTTPPLWEGIAGRLGAVDAEIQRSAAGAVEAPGDAPSRWPIWSLGAGAAVATALLAVIVLRPNLPAPGASSLPVVQSLVTEGKPVMVLDEGEGDTTIIWVIDGPLDEVSGRVGRATG